MPPAPPYYAVIFTSRSAAFREGYEDMAREMEETAARQPGFLGIDSVCENGTGITVSYWRDLESVKQWKNHPRHLVAQKTGREKWYDNYRVRIAKVEREYGMQRAP
ncbi:MAG: antibiotic biosynthesis monooxygenase family protein [Gammaproteobacteria bacterium]